MTLAGGHSYHPRAFRRSTIRQHRFPTRTRLLVGLLWALTASSCGSGEPPAPPTPDPASLTGPEAGLVEIHERAGIEFVHRHGGSGKKYMVETMGSGGGILDYDGDGLEDIYLIQGGALPGYRGPEPLHNALYRNLGDGTFEDVTVAARAEGRPWGMGFCSGDLDNDGDADIYLSNFGPDMLLINQGDGTFIDGTESWGVRNPAWGASCAMADVDGNGGLDIYVTNYVSFTLENNKPCGNRGRNLLSYCHPDVYDGVSDVLFTNNLDGTFRDATRQAGLYQPEGKGLGAVFSDYDGDGDIDLYVANDSVANFLFENDGTGRFTEEGLFAGVAYNESGQTQAGMGVDMGDVDGDGDPDIFVTNLDSETNAFYRNRGDGTFSDDSFPSGLGEDSVLFVGFGTNMFDVENDGDLDVLVANGHILDDAESYNQSVTYRQRAHLFVNDGTGTFQERGEELGGFFLTAGVARGSSTFDLEGDGDLDVLITYNNGAPKLLLNTLASRGHWLKVRLLGRTSSRDAVGARIAARAGGRRVMREIQAGRSYLSQSSLVAHLGLGDARLVEELEIRWPGGDLQTFGDIDTDRTLVIDQAEGILSP